MHSMMKSSYTAVVLWCVHESCIPAGDSIAHARNTSSSVRVFCVIGWRIPVYKSYRLGKCLEKRVMMNDKFDEIISHHNMVCYYYHAG